MYDATLLPFCIIMYGNLLYFVVSFCHRTNWIQLLLLTMGHWFGSFSDVVVYILYNKKIHKAFEGFTIHFLLNIFYWNLCVHLWQRANINCSFCLGLYSNAKNHHSSVASSKSSKGLFMSMSLPFTFVDFIILEFLSMGFSACSFFLCCLATWNF